MQELTDRVFERAAVQLALLDYNLDSAALAAPMNATTTNIVAIGSFLSTAMALAFALPGVKNLFDLIQAILEIKEESAAKIPQQETTENTDEEATTEESQI